MGLDIDRVLDAVPPNPITAEQLSDWPLVRAALMASASNIQCGYVWARDAIPNPKSIRLAVHLADHAVRRPDEPTTGPENPGEDLSPIPSIVVGEWAPLSHTEETSPTRDFAQAVDDDMKKTLTAEQYNDYRRANIAAAAARAAQRELVRLANPTCATCRFFMITRIVGLDAADRGDCHRNPPSPGQTSKWSEVEGWNWCGEHKQKP